MITVQLKKGKARLKPSGKAPPIPSVRANPFIWGEVFQSNRQPDIHCLIVYHPGKGSDTYPACGANGSHLSETLQIFPEGPEHFENLYTEFKRLRGLLYSHLKDKPHTILMVVANDSGHKDRVQRELRMFNDFLLAPPPPQ